MTVAVFETSIDASEIVATMVGSFVTLPSVSSPSSLTSLTSLLFPGLLAVAVTVFAILPVFAASCSIV